MAEPIASTPSLEEFVRDDVIEALMGEGFSRTQAEQTFARGTGVTFSDLFKTSLNWLTRQRSGYRSIPTSAPRKESPIPEVQPTTAKPNGHAPAKRYCAGYERECGQVLRDRNTSGLCARCYARKSYHDNKGLKSKPTKTAQKPAKSAAAESPASAPPLASRVTLEVTEGQLDQFLVRLPLEDKQRLANHYLQLAE